MEDRVTKNFQDNANLFKDYQHVAILHDLSLMKNEKRTQIEILKGRYSIHLGRKLPFNRKVEKFAFEPMAFHLHKKRDFFIRLEDREATKREREAELY